MQKRMTLILLAIVALLIAACNTQTEGEAGDTTSAQTLQPNIAGYEVRDVDNIVDGFSTAIAASAVTSGNVPLAVAIERINTTLECLQDTGAISGQIYIQQEDVQVVPQGGTSIVVNLDRVQRNVFGCVTDQPLSAQSLSIEPCFQTGQFTYEEQTFVYMYAGAGANICAAFQTHFVTGLGATITSEYP